MDELLDAIEPDKQRIPFYERLFVQKALRNPSWELVVPFALGLGGSLAMSSSDPKTAIRNIALFHLAKGVATAIGWASGLLAQYSLSGRAGDFFGDETLYSKKEVVATLLLGTIGATVGFFSMDLLKTAEGQPAHQPAISYQQQPAQPLRMVKGADGKIYSCRPE